MTESGVTVTVMDAPVGPGVVTRVRFESAVGARVYFQPCTRTVERQVAAGWEPLPPELRMCTAEVYTLEAGGTRTEFVDLPVDLTPGTYRLVFPATAEGWDIAVSLRSVAFPVQAAP